VQSYTRSGSAGIARDGHLQMLGSHAAVASADHLRGCTSLLLLLRCASILRSSPGLPSPGITLAPARVLECWRETVARTSSHQRGSVPQVMTSPGEGPHRAQGHEQRGIAELTVVDNCAIIVVTVLVSVERCANLGQINSFTPVGVKPALSRSIMDLR
jgi:hypothetical protein